MRWNCNWTLAIYALQGLVGSLGYYLLLQNIPGETLWICKKKKGAGGCSNKAVSEVARSLIASVLP